MEARIAAIVNKSAIVAAAAAREPFVIILSLQNCESDGYEESQKGSDEYLKRSVTLYFLDRPVFDSEARGNLATEKIQGSCLETRSAPHAERIPNHDHGKAKRNDEKG